MYRITRLLAFSFLWLLTPTVLQAQTLNCKVAIVGGGAAGMHSFFRLAPFLKDGVCLFEANDYFGGRIKDIASPPPFGSPPGTPSPGVYAAGALRVQETQNVLYNLATELGFPLQKQTGNFEIAYGPNRVFARGRKQENSNNFLRFPKSYAAPRPGNNFPDPNSTYPADGTGYPDQSTAVSCWDGGNYNGCFSDAYYHSLLNPKYLPKPRQFNSNLDWLRSHNVLRPEGFQFLTDTFRFRGDFQNGVDPISYINFLAEDWDVCCNPSYPKGGMSSFIKGMLARASKHSQNFFLSTPVTSIGKQGNKYLLQTKNFDVLADSVIIATPAVALKKIGGTIASKIIKDPHFQAIVPVRVVAIDHWWKTAWWENTKGANDSGPIDRAWSTKFGIPNSSRVCFNFYEGPHSAYEKKQFATRSVYNDDTICSNFWGTLKKNQGIAGVNKEIIRELNLVFPELPKKLCNNNQSAGLCVEDITQTNYTDWPDAWYWLKGPTQLTNDEIAIWALQPIPGEKVSLTSDAYNPNRTTWSDGAFKSSLNTLDFNYSNMPGHQARITKILPKPLPCNSVVIRNGKPTYLPFNKGGVFNANCPLIVIPDRIH